jgi:predicted RNA-binding protein with PUA domain
MSQQLVDAKTGDVLPQELQHAISMMKEQLLIVLVNRLGGKADISVKEIDGTGDFFMIMEFDKDQEQFRFVVKRKD